LEKTRQEGDRIAKVVMPSSVLLRFFNALDAMDDLPQFHPASSPDATPAHGHPQQLTSAPDETGSGMRRPLATKASRAA
jgi:hypothetical protein